MGMKGNNEFLLWVEFSKCLLVGRQTSQRHIYWLTGYILELVLSCSPKISLVLRAVLQGWTKTVFCLHPVWLLREAYSSWAFGKFCLLCPVSLVSNIRHLERLVKKKARYKKELQLSHLGKWPMFWVGDIGGRSLILACMNPQQTHWLCNVKEPDVSFSPVVKVEHNHFPIGCGWN